MSFFYRLVELGGDTTLQELKPPPPGKTTILHCILYEPASGLSTLLSLLLFPPSLLGSRSIKSENHRKHHLGRQERLRQVWPHDKGLGLDLHRSG